MSSNDPKGRELTACQRRWLAHLQAWQAQGELGLKAYAQRHGLSVSALYTAKRFFKQHGIWQGREVSSTRRRQARAKLVPVRIEAPPLAMRASAMYRVHLPNGLVVEVPEHAEPASTHRLLSGLMGAPS